MFTIIANFRFWKILSDISKTKILVHATNNTQLTIHMDKLTDIAQRMYRKLENLQTISLIPSFGSIYFSALVEGATTSG